MKCVVCDHRPARDAGICPNCQSKIRADKRKRQAKKPVKFATYRGHVIGFYHNGNGNGLGLTPRLLRRSAENLPRTNTINLDGYVDGMTRAQVKKIKAAILQLAA